MHILIYLLASVAYIFPNVLIDYISSQCQGAMSVHLHMNIGKIIFDFGWI